MTVNDVKQLKVIARLLDEGCRAGVISTDEVERAQLKLNKIAEKQGDELFYLVYEVQALIHWVNSDETEAFELMRSAVTLRGSTDLFTTTGKNLANKLIKEKWTGRDTALTALMVPFWLITFLVVITSPGISKKKKQKIISIGTLILIAIALIINVYQRPPQDTSKEPMPSDFLSLVNNERTKKGVPILKIDTRLNESAQFKADDMTNRNYFSHQDPKTNTYNGLDKAQQLDPDCIYLSENISENQSNDPTSPYSTVYGWVQSPEHYAAMVDPKYSTTGFGISGKFVVEHFCQTK